MTNPIPGADSAPNPRAFIDMNGGYQSERTGVDKEAHDAWVKSTSWDLTRDDFIRLSYFHGDMESGSDGRGPINGSEDLPGDVVYVHPEKGALTRSMVSYWFSDSNSFMHGFKTARAAAKVGANVAADIPTWQERRDYDILLHGEAQANLYVYLRAEIAALRARIAGEKTNGA